MIQLQFSSALDKGRKYDHKVLCMQRNQFGLYVGTLQQNEDGYTGHLLSPKHPLLPASASSRLGFLHSNRDEAFEILALHVAKRAWSNDPSFDLTCLDKCSRATRLAFSQWLEPKSAAATAWPFKSAPQISSSFAQLQTLPAASVNLNAHQSSGVFQ